MRVSEDWQVWIGEKELPVWEALKNTNHGTHDITRMSFVGFDLDKPLVVRIRAKKPGAVEVRPYAENIPTEKRGEELFLTLKKPTKLILTRGTGYEGTLILTANPPHLPPKPESVTRYFASGVHEVGELALKSGDRVYLAEGAIVKGWFALQKVENVQITGRGILSLGHLPHKEDFRVFKGDATQNILIEGLTVCNAPGWIVSFWNGNSNLTVRNLKLVGSFRYNTDGVQTGTDGLLVEDCLLQCNDDNFSLNGVCKNVVIRNNLLWNLYNGGVFMLGWATGQQFELRNFDVHHNVIFRAGGCCDYDRKAPFSLKLFGSNRVAENLKFSDIDIEDIAPYGRWLDFQAEKATKSVVRKIQFENITIRKTWRVEAELRGTSDGAIEEVAFTNLVIQGKRVASPQDAGLNLIRTKNTTIDSKSFPDGIVFEAKKSGSESPQQSTVSSSAQAAGPNLLEARQKELRGSVMDQKQVDITMLLKVSGPGVYRYGVRVRGKDFPVKVTLLINDEQHPSPDVLLTGEGSQSVERTQPVRWDELRRAVLRIEVANGKRGSFQLEGIWLQRSGG